MTPGTPATFARTAATVASLLLLAGTAAHGQEYVCTVSDDPTVAPIALHAEPGSAEATDAIAGAMLFTLKATGDDEEAWVEVGAVRTDPPNTFLTEGYLPAEHLDCPDSFDQAKRKSDNMVCASVSPGAEFLAYFEEPGGAKIADFAAGTNFLVGGAIDKDGELWVEAEGYATLNPVGWVRETDFERCALWE